MLFPLSFPSECSSLMIISISIIFVVIPISPLTRPRQAPAFSAPLSLLHYTTLLSSEAFCGYVKVVICHCRLISQGRMNCICAMTSLQKKTKTMENFKFINCFPDLHNSTNVASLVYTVTLRTDNPLKTPPPLQSPLRIPSQSSLNGEPLPRVFQPFHCSINISPAILSS